MGQRLQYIVRLLCGCLTAFPALCGITRELDLPPGCPLLQFPTSSSSSSEHVPGEDHCCFFPFISRVRHLLNRLCVHLSPSHSILPMFIQLSALSPSPFPTHLTLRAFSVSALERSTASHSPIHLFQIILVPIVSMPSPPPSSFPLLSPCFGPTGCRVDCNLYLHPFKATQCLHHTWGGKHLKICTGLLCKPTWWQEKDHLMAHSDHSAQVQEFKSPPPSIYLLSRCSHASLISLWS